MHVWWETLWITYTLLALSQTMEVWFNEDGQIVQDLKKVGEKSLE